MRFIPDRRTLLKFGAALPFAAATASFARPPIERVGGSSLKISLNAYSFSKLLNNHNKKREVGMTLLQLLDFCAKNNIVCDIEMTTFDKINEAWERVIKNDVKYRFVLDHKSLK